MELLAQAIPDAAWWQSWGVLGILAMLAAAGAAAYYWQVTLPHAKATKEMDLQERASRIALQDKLTETFPELASTQRQATQLLERMDKRQEGHAKDCQASHELLQRVAAKVLEG
jgi:hypothetical protein